MIRKLTSTHISSEVSLLTVVDLVRRAFKRALLTFRGENLVLTT